MTSSPIAIIDYQLGNLFSVKMACDKVGAKVDETSADGLFTIKTVMCLAACDRAPMLQCNLKYHESLNEEKFDQLVARWREEAASGQQEKTVVEKIAAYAIRP